MFLETKIPWQKSKNVLSLLCLRTTSAFWYRRQDTSRWTQPSMRSSTIPEKAVYGFFLILNIALDANYLPKYWKARSLFPIKGRHVVLSMSHRIM
eukprot:g1649.t1